MPKVTKEEMIEYCVRKIMQLHVRKQDCFKNSTRDAEVIAEIKSTLESSVDLSEWITKHIKICASGLMSNYDNAHPGYYVGMGDLLKELEQHTFTLQPQDWKKEVIQEIENSKMEISDMINDAFDGENLFPTQVTLNTISKKLITKIKEM
jgi:hypothetical protein